MECISAIVGTRFRGSPAFRALGLMKAGDEVALKREPANSFDRLAVACAYGGVDCGYLPRAVNSRIAPLLDRGIAVTAVITKAPVLDDSKIKVEPVLRLIWEEPTP